LHDHCRNTTVRPVAPATASRPPVALVRPFPFCPFSPSLLAPPAVNTCSVLPPRHPFRSAPITRKPGTSALFPFLLPSSAKKFPTVWNPSRTCRPPHHSTRPRQNGVLLLPLPFTAYPPGATERYTLLIKQDLRWMRMPHETLPLCVHPPAAASQLAFFLRPPPQPQIFG